MQVLRGSAKPYSGVKREARQTETKIQNSQEGGVLGRVSPLKKDLLVRSCRKRSVLRMHRN